METLVHIIRIIYVITSSLLCLWIIYLFTIREWLDRLLMRRGGMPYDLNGIPRMQSIQRLYHLK